MVPETSYLAYKSQSPAKISNDHKRIYGAVADLKEANYEAIARRIGECDLCTVSRRLKEMEEKGLIRKTGRKSLTSRGRLAFTYQTEIGRVEQ